jgi:hypothetical protein
LSQIVPQQENLAKLVFLVRGEKVLLDADLAMLSSVLRFQRAVEVNIPIMRTFVQLRLRNPDALTCCPIHHPTHQRLHDLANRRQHTRSTR